MRRKGGQPPRKRISAHALRHSIGTHLYRTTKNSKAVQNFLGHSSVSTTLSYYVHDAFEYADVERFTRLGEHNGGEVTGTAAELQTMHPHDDEGQLELTLAAVGE
jgi:integrase